MLKALGSRLSYANVVATGSLFLALGGGAYALSGIPDHGGVFHGCVSNATGVLRVVKRASSCHKAVRRGRHRSPGEFAVSWNQQGPRGLQGIQGVQGQKGVQGVQGLPGPTFGTAAVSEGGFVSDPPATPDESASNAATVARETTFSLPSAGHVYLRFFTPAIIGTCSVGTARAGLYLDGSPVPRTSQALQNTTRQPGEWVAVVQAAAGSHTADVRKDCPASNGVGGFDEDDASTWSVVLLS